METLNLVFLSVTLALAIKLLHHLFTKAPTSTKLPPGPPPLPLLGNIFLFRKSFLDLGPILGRLRSTYGPVVTLYVGPQPSVFVVDHATAHQALVEKAAQFADRPPPIGASRIYSSDGHNISSAAYGPIWRHLRRNLTSGILHPSRIKSYAWVRGQVLDRLLVNIRARAKSDDGVVTVADLIQETMFRLLILMCFGGEISNQAIRDVEAIQRELIGIASKLTIFELWPKLAKFFQRKTWNSFLKIRSKQEEIMSSIIKSHRENRQQEQNDALVSYVDTVIDLELPEEGGRKLDDKEIVTLCSEFLNAGTDTTATALQWIIANLVKHQEVQNKLREEIGEVVGAQMKIEEEHLQRMPYLKAVVLEGLRRHPPGPFVLPHMVTLDNVFLGSYAIPKGALMNFTVAEMGWDAQTWEKPMEFRPERFMAGGPGEGVDITGSKEIKMMPFGAGRRICPGIGLAMLHLEYFVANLVREFQWQAVGNEEIDLSEKLEFTVVMKNTLRARILTLTS